MGKKYHAFPTASTSHSLRTCIARTTGNPDNGTPTDPSTTQVTALLFSFQTTVWSRNTNLLAPTIWMWHPAIGPNSMEV
jgi:hypothetical protein